MSLIENAAPILAHALKELLGPSLSGSMAFIRCLPGEVARELASDQRFAVPGWRIAVVGQTADETARSITADQAVEWREDKADAVLLVDTAQAGAGMDGIYSAAREINEAELFATAKSRARSKLEHGGKGFAVQSAPAGAQQSLVTLARICLSVPRRLQHGRVGCGLAGNWSMAGCVCRRKQPIPVWLH